MKDASMQDRTDRLFTRKQPDHGYDPQAGVYRVQMKIFGGSYVL
jgi:hypothetical protein